MNESNNRIKRGLILAAEDISPNEIPKVVLDELEQTPASQLDIFYLRKTIVRHADNFQEVNSLVSKINNELIEIRKNLDAHFTIEVVNGKTEVRKINDLIKELWERDSMRRDTARMMKIITRHKKKSLAGLIFIILAIIVYRDETHSLIDWIATNFFDIIKWIF